MTFFVHTFHITKSIVLIVKEITRPRQSVSNLVLYRKIKSKNQTTTTPNFLNQEQMVKSIFMCMSEKTAAF